MKKYFYTVLFAVMAFTHTSCGSGPDVPAEPPYFEFAEADAEAGVAAAIEFGDLALLPPPFDFAPAFAIVVLGGMSSAAAVNGHPEYPGRSVYDPKTVYLPKELEIPTNPYENIGRMHNTVLDYIKKTPAADPHALLQDQSLSKIIDRLFAEPGNIASASKKLDTKKEMMTKFEEETKTDDTWDEKFVAPSSVEIENSISRTSHTAIQDYMSTFMARVKKIDRRNATETIGFINGEINAVLGSTENQQERSLKLIYLSIYKNSYYFWVNNY